MQPAERRVEVTSGGRWGGDNQDIWRETTSTTNIMQQY